jgi:hypothetical protein
VRRLSVLATDPRSPALVLVTAPRRGDPDRVHHALLLRDGARRGPGRAARDGDVPEPQRDVRVPLRLYASNGRYTASTRDIRTFCTGLESCVAWYWWVVAALLLGLVEVVTVDLIFIMLAAGALSGAATAFVTGLPRRPGARRCGGLAPAARRRSARSPSVTSGSRSRAGPARQALVGRTAWSSSGSTPTTAASRSRRGVVGPVVRPLSHPRGGTSAEVLRIDGAHAVVYPSEP